MREPRSFASLSSGLLARKGQASPAMRRQGVDVFQAGDDLGWNDMGLGQRPQAETIPVPEVVRQQAELGAALADASAIASPAPVPSAPERAAPAPADEPDTGAPVPVEPSADGDARPVGTVPAATASGSPKAAFTLRLAADRHLRLRLACAVEARSAQAIVTQALDAYLDTIPRLEVLAGHVSGPGAAS